MKFEEWDSFKENLDRVRLESDQQLRLRRYSLSNFVSIDLDQLKYDAVTTVVLGGAFSRENVNLEFDNEYKAKMYGLASIFQLVLLAADVHDRILDNGNLSEQPSKNSVYYPVLIGDCIYGALLRKLCDIGCSELLPELAKAICDINEGTMRRDELIRSGGSFSDMVAAIKQEYGSVFKQAACTGLWLAGGSKEDADIYGEMASSIGMAVGADLICLDPVLVQACQRESLNLYGKLEYGWLREVSQYLLRYAGIEHKRLRAASGQ